MTDKRRFYSLDVVRGLAIMIMLFVDAPPGAVAYPLFIHAPWEGLTFADFAFPGFVFAMGMSAAVSMSRRKPSTRKIFTRAALLFAIGILFNTLPIVMMYVLWPDFTAANFYDEAIRHLRPFGILQRLALVYVLGILLARAIRSDVGIIIAAFVLLIVSSAGFHVYSPENPFDQTHNLSGAIDLVVPGANHIYTPTHDPEGLYGSIAGTASVLFGFLAGRVLIDNSTTREKIFLLTAAGVVLLIAGGLWSSLDIVSKKLWTSSYTLINAGGDALLLALFMKLFDAVPSSKKFFRPLKALGTNPIFFFTANCLVLIVVIFVPSPNEELTFYQWLFSHTTENFISPKFGATLFCVMWCLMWLPIAEIFYRRGITIKI